MKAIKKIQNFFLFTVVVVFALIDCLNFEFLFLNFLLLMYKSFIEFVHCNLYFVRLKVLRPTRICII